MGGLTGDVGRVEHVESLDSSGACSVFGGSYGCYRYHGASVAAHEIHVEIVPPLAVWLLSLDVHAVHAVE